MSQPASAVPGPADGRELADIGSLLRRRRVAVAGCVLAGVCGGGVALATTPPSYTATAEVLVAPTSVQDQLNQTTPRQREPLNLDTEAHVARSAVVAARAARSLKAGDPETMRGQVTVSVPPNSAVLAVSYTARDPISAAAGAQAFAKAYLANRRATATQALAAQLKMFTAKLREVNATLAATVAGLARHPQGSAARTIAAQRQNVLNRQIHTLTARYDALKTVAVTPGAVISDARPPGAPTAPSLPLYLGSGLFLGLLAGVGAAVLRDRVDTRLRTAADVERLTGLPVLCEGENARELRELAMAVARHLRDGGELLVRSVTPGTDPEPIADDLRVALTGLAPIWVRTDHSARADAALLLVESRAARSKQLAQAVRQLRRTDTAALGVILLPSPAELPRPTP
ncbi:Wzz/FepE/Etk N-terminal domain-containing protein [Sphaerisporangium sp. TRM90804]|uniref:Wzz/FepE/Etk N-terminal domain-containing protein n=1 Tax=Sphaerisporangium sp. TRM90804 TaxID=3031113 RepID=UPI00244C601B|nr:Wzz/FepE/Etk N-terminal domain-containing protein [Sphaerisporangium sp. TRM90804]MDH2428756.1 Wzz/FepE/Etk N-terminal domain-containing protein [Sphaerisporangium sp. TRM90804]